MADYECPYDYLLGQYGRHHFQPFVDKLRPSLSTEDPIKYVLILDIMDAVHFCAILVDDIADGSLQRKNKPAAHVVFGANETSNRAYLVLMRVINRAMRENPVLATELLKSLQEIHLGQDESLVWRRHGLEALPHGDSERLAAYQRMAQLKTGSLFVLLGRLLNDGGTELDAKLLQLGWYAQLQNDCKNIYSAEYARNKGSVAEDVRNGEMSYPIMVGSITDSARNIIEKALETRCDADIEEALEALDSPAVRMTCLEALKEASHGVEDLIALWGRRETMTTAPSDSTTSTRDGDMASVDTMTTTEPSHELSAADVAHWDQKCVPMLTSLLESCGVYSTQDRDTQIRFLQEHVLPNLGPRPSGPESQIVPMVTSSGFPWQPSINISGTGTAKVRYLFEPLDALSGTTTDPFALGPAKRMLRTFADHLGVWTGWIEALISAYHPTPEEVQQIQPKLGQYLKETGKRTAGQVDVELSEIPRLWVSFVAFDLDGQSQAMKAYFDPKLKEAVTGIPSDKYAFQVLRGLEAFGNATGVDIFLAERNSVGAVEVIAIDCVPESMQPSARIKVYVHTMSNSFKTVRDYVTLGGRLTDHATMEGLGRLRGMWHHLMGEPEGINDEEWDKSLTGLNPMQHRLYISYEMKAGDSPPAVKVYIPTHNHHPSDDACVNNLEGVFRQCGWPWGKEGAYRKVVESAFGPANHQHASFLHEFSSFSFTEGEGIYQSIYLSPPGEVDGKVAESESRDAPQVLDVD